jgi:hypothetical protein
MPNSYGDGPNLYAFAGTAPLMWRDPFGLSKDRSWAAGIWNRVADGDVRGLGWGGGRSLSGGGRRGRRCLRRTRRRGHRCELRAGAGAAVGVPAIAVGAAVAGAGTALSPYHARRADQAQRHLNEIHSSDRPTTPTNSGPGSGTASKGEGDIHGIGGGDPANLALKPAEAKLDPPGISVLKADTPGEAAAQMRAAFPSATRLHEAARCGGTSCAAKIREAGFDVIPDPTKKFPNHHRIVHPDGAAGFTLENLKRLSDAFFDMFEN